MVSVYLAARWEDAALMREWRGVLLDFDIECTSSWLDVAATGLMAIEDDDQVMRKNAILDIEDVARADALVFHSPAESKPGRGGCHVEFGAALALGKPVILVGKQENVFHWHPRVAVLPEGASFDLIARTILESVRG